MHFGFIQNYLYFLTSNMEGVELTTIDITFFIEIQFQMDFY
jgi:hypothetical protein